VYRLPRRMIEETFATFRSCGAGERECKLYWASSWSDPASLTHLVHPKHEASAYGVSLDDAWISRFWLDMADQDLGVRVQVHTHPGEAFHSKTDDAFPLIHEHGFLSLVIPDFAFGPVGFERAYLTEIQADGSWKQVSIRERLLVDE
jgi:proteasome lid subunit RPN8/RPN11